MDWIKKQVTRVLPLKAVLFYALFFFVNCSSTLGFDSVCNCRAGLCVLKHCEHKTLQCRSLKLLKIDKPVTNSRNLSVSQPLSAAERINLKREKIPLNSSGIVNDLGVWFSAKNRILYHLLNCSWFSAIVTKDVKWQSSGILMDFSLKSQSLTSAMARVENSSIEEHNRIIS